MSEYKNISQLYEIDNKSSYLLDKNDVLKKTGEILVPIIALLGIFMNFANICVSLLFKLPCLDKKRKIIQNQESWQIYSELERASRRLESSCSRKISRESRENRESKTFEDMRLENISRGDNSSIPVSPLKSPFAKLETVFELSEEADSNLKSRSRAASE